MRMESYIGNIPFWFRFLKCYKFFLRHGNIESSPSENSPTRKYTEGQEIYESCRKSICLKPHNTYHLWQMYRQSSDRKQKQKKTLKKNDNNLKFSWNEKGIYVHAVLRTNR